MAALLAIATTMALLLQTIAVVASVATPTAIAVVRGFGAVSVGVVVRAITVVAIFLTGGSSSVLRGSSVLVVVAAPSDHSPLVVVGVVPLVVGLGVVGVGLGVIEVLVEVVALLMAPQFFVVVALLVVGTVASLGSSLIR